MTPTVSSRLQLTAARRTEVFYVSYTQLDGLYSFELSALLALRLEAVAWTAEKAVAAGFTASRIAVVCIIGISTPVLAIRLALYIYSSRNDAFDFARRLARKIALETKSWSLSIHRQSSSVQESQTGPAYSSTSRTRLM